MNIEGLLTPSIQTHHTAPPVSTSTQSNYRPATPDNSFPEWLRVRPELTVTIKQSKNSDSPPLDLSTNPTKNDPTSAQRSSFQFPLVLKPDEYENLAPKNSVFATYAFLPSLSVFVHPLAIPQELASSAILPSS